MVLIDELGRLLKRSLPLPSRVLAPGPLMYGQRTDDRSQHGLPVHSERSCDHVSKRLLMHMWRVREDGSRGSHDAMGVARACPGRASQRNWPTRTSLSQPVASMMRATAVLSMQA